MVQVMAVVREDQSWVDAFLQALELPLDLRSLIWKKPITVGPNRDVLALSSVKEKAGATKRFLATQGAGTENDPIHADIRLRLEQP